MRESLLLIKGCGSGAIVAFSILSLLPGVWIRSDCGLRLVVACLCEWSL